MWTASASTSPPPSGGRRGQFDPAAAIFKIIGQDPVLARAKLIAEPWDIGQPDSYALGRFPARVERVERPLP